MPYLIAHSALPAAEQSPAEMLQNLQCMSLLQSYHTWCKQFSVRKLLTCQQTGVRQQTGVLDYRHEQTSCPAGSLLGLTMHLITAR